MRQYAFSIPQRLIVGRVGVFIILAALIPSFRASHSEGQTPSVIVSSTVSANVPADSPQHLSSKLLGRTTVWRFSWRVPSSNRSKLALPKLLVTDHLLSKEGYEQVSLIWERPFRDDLTPNVLYYRLTPGLLVTASGNRRGPRAIIQRADDSNSLEALNPLEQLLIFPSQLLGEASCSKSIDAIEISKVRQQARIDFETEASLKRGGMFQESAILQLTCDAIDLHGSLGDEEQVSLQVFKVAAESIAHTSHLLPEYHGNIRTIVGIPAAFDLESTNASPDRPEWEGRTQISYRVLLWQIVDGAESRGYKLCLPRIAVWEEAVRRPRLPEKNYHTRSILMYEVQFNEQQQVRRNWETLIPNLRVLDVYRGVSRVIRTPRDESIVWNFILEASNSAANFEKLLHTELRLCYTPCFQPLGQLLDSYWPNTPNIGTMRSSDQFRPFQQDDALHSIALGDLPGGDSSGTTSRKQITVSLKNAGSSDNRSTNWSETSIVGRHPPSSALNELDTLRPDLLRVADSIRRIADESSNPTGPRRRGYVEVSAHQQASGIRHLIAVHLLLASVLMGAFAFVYWQRQRAARCRIRNSAAWIAILTCGMHAAVANAESTGHDSTAEAPRLSNVTEVRSAIASHCRLLHSVLPINRDDELWQALVCEHIALRSHAKLPSKSKNVLRAKAIFEQLENLYSRATFVSDEDRLAPLSDPRTSSSLGSTLLQRTANCYSLAFAYLLHCRLGDCDVEMLAFPSHVMLAVADRPSQSLAGVPRIYDPIRRCWLTTQQRQYWQSLSNSVLHDREIDAIAAFNIGTVLCRGGDYERGVPLLVEATRLRFPFVDGDKNLCLAYLESGQVVELINHVESHPHLLRLSGSTNDMRPDVIRGQHDILLLYILALNKNGNDAKAIKYRELLIKYGGSEF